MYKNPLIQEAVLMMAVAMGAVIYLVYRKPASSKGDEIGRSTLSLIFPRIQLSADASNY